MNHYKIVCRSCGDIIGQCRCMACDKIVKTELCYKCKEKSKGEMNDLKSCPFCSSKAKFEPRYVERGGIVYGIECINLACGIRIESATTSNVVKERWNKRYDSLSGVKNRTRKEAINMVLEILRKHHNKEIYNCNLTCKKIEHQSFNVRAYLEIDALGKK